MTQLDRDGRWDQGPLVSSLERREFPAILIWKTAVRSGCLQGVVDPVLLQAIDENFRPTHEYGGNVV